MGLIVRKPGILTTVQDLGRNGHRSSGINPSGVMDRTATRILNLLVGNVENDAVLEMHFPAAEIEFETECRGAVGGADFSPRLDGVPIDNWRSFTAEAGSILKFTGKRSGSRCYLAVHGGLDIGTWLGSSSTNLAAAAGGWEGRALRSGDRIPIKEPSAARTTSSPFVSPSLIPFYSRFSTVRIVAGAEYDRLDERSKTLLTDQDLAVSNESNRMGFRLRGERLSLVEPVELISSAVTFGTIQLLPDGQLIVLMADHQTSGGYPRIANVISVDLPLIGQLGPGDKLAFHLISVAEAEELARQLESDLQFFRVGCRFL